MRIAFAVCRDFIFVSTVTFRPVIGLHQISWSLIAGCDPDAYLIVPSEVDDIVINAQKVASSLKNYIDTNEMEHYSEANEYLEKAQIYAIEVVTERMAYLSEAGLSDEEISEIMGTADSSEKATDLQ